MLATKRSRSRSLLAAALAVTGFGATAAADEVQRWGINFPPPASTTAQEIYDIHMLTMGIATILLVIIFAVVIYSLIVHRKSRGYPADQRFHETWFGRWSWVFVPVMVLGVDLTIAGAAQKTLERVWVVPQDQPLLDVKVIGHQWYWEFVYLDHDVKIESRYVPKEEAGIHYLREVDNRLVLPIHQRVRFLHTASDVLHAFWVPELAVKKDAIPGYVTETWVNLTREGVFRGQCAELCGTWHARMPIVVESVSQERFDAWIEDQKQIKLAALAEATAEREWDKDELMARGERLYNTMCAACHQADGSGMPPAFPAIRGSAVATGPIPRHMEVVLKGVPGTAMAAWNSLNDLEIASIITYQRNAWGNDTGDVVQPSDVNAAR